MQRTRSHSKRRTTRAVYFWDRAASAVISVGGVGILVAVLGICVYLLWTVLPLFRHGSAAMLDASQIGPFTRVATVIGEYNQAIASLDENGTLHAASLRGGSEILATPLPEPHRVTAAARAGADGIAVAFDDGSLQLGRMALDTSPLPEDEVTPRMASFPVGSQYTRPARENRPGTVIERVGESRWRQTSPVLTLTELQPPEPDHPIVRLDMHDNGAGARFLAFVRAGGEAELGSIRTVTPLGGDEPVARVSGIEFTLANPARGLPDYFFVTGDGRHVLALWADGTLERYSPQSGKVRLAETLSVSAGAARLTAATMLLGGMTVLVGDEAGDVRAYQPARDPTAPGFDSFRMTQSDAFNAAASPVVAIASSGRDRLIAVYTQGGELVVRHMTSRKVVFQTTDAGPGTPSDIFFSPRGDALLALSQEGGYSLRTLSPGHADASLASLFAPIRYEGELKPEFIYQSSAGSEGAEVKLSLIPLIYGTLKATVVAMFIATPLAVLGAIYTSEFMGLRSRRIVKPVIELMASLPSVVLGFVAAIVVAPFLARWLPQVLIGITLTPVLMGLLAHLWQLVPMPRRAWVSRRARVGVVAMALLVSIVASVAAAPAVSAVLFAPTQTDRLLAAGSYTSLPQDQWPAWVGRRESMSPSDERALRREGFGFRDGAVVRVNQDGSGTIVEQSLPQAEAPIRRWLNGSIGGAYPGWLLALLLPSLLGIYLLQHRVIDRAVFERMLGRDRGALATAELLRYLLTLVAGAGLAAALAAVLTSAGLDTRDSIFGPFSQRNSLVVGIIMGFAVIPIIYTISEDALRSVPNHLRSASLGLGATPWQTAVRIVLPAAGSGVFSAIMIGLGRAVGETMIVLMATGNTPEISSNLFAGFRTLSANIAVELPEAVRDGTHYRVLFLCGLVLFIMTFIVNTTAEIVRQRFRKRNAAL